MPTGPTDLQQFFTSISKKSVDGELFWKNYVYIALNEWHWSYEQIHETPIRFVLDAITFRAEVKKKEEQASKRKK